MKKWIVTLTIVLALLASSLACVALETRAPEATVPTPSQGGEAAVPTRPPVVVEGDTALSDLQSEVEAVYQAVGDSVVNISVTSMAYDFFMRPIPQEGTGSGFVYDDKGHIVTNYHVVAGAQEINVAFADGTNLPAKVVGVDQMNDLAVIQVDADQVHVPPLTLGDSDDLHVGQFVVAIGNPFGLERTLTFGVISSLGRIIESPEEGYFIGDAIQTDAAINPGNSGGPLLDLEGRVLGVNAQIVSPSRASAGIGFAIPVNTVKRVVPELIANGHYDHPYMGVQLFDLSRYGDMLRRAGVDVPTKGLLILEVEPNSPAEKAGLRGGDHTITFGGARRFPVGGDIITAINGHEVASWRDLNTYLELHTHVGDTIELTILRDGKEQTVSLTLGARPQP